MRSTPGSSRSRPQRKGRFAMRREGSPWQGLGTVLLKELADHFDSARMVLLKLFNPGGQTLSVVAILGFVIPVIAVGLGFDAVNGEHNRRTLSRILAQPIYRDALLAGKFLAA